MAILTLGQSIGSIVKRRGLAMHFSPPRRDRISVIIAPSHRLIYIVLPKCACTTIKAHLCKFDQRIPVEIDNTTTGLSGIFRSVTSNVKPRSLHKNYDNYTIFTFLRNPTERLISLYRDKVVNDFYPAFSRFGLRKGMKFRDFVETICAIPDSRADHHFRSQYSLISYKAQLLADFIGTVENLDHGLPYLLSKFEPDGVEDRLFHYNKKANTGGSIEITHEIATALKMRYSNDYHLHEYISASPSGRLDNIRTKRLNAGELS